jgi:hypothetical protein
LDQYTCCFGLILPGSDAMRTAWAATSFDGAGRLTGGGLGAGRANFLIGCHVCDFGGAVRVIFIRVPRGWKISGHQDISDGKQKLGSR